MAGEEAARRLRGSLDQRFLFVCLFCAVLDLPRSSHMLGQRQACLWLRPGLGKIKAMGDILKSVAELGGSCLGRLWGAWMTTGWSEVPPSALQGEGLVGWCSFEHFGLLPPGGSVITR